MRAREWPGPVRLSDPFEELFVAGLGATVPDDARCLDRPAAVFRMRHWLDGGHADGWARAELAALLEGGLGGATGPDGLVPARLLAQVEQGSLRVHVRRRPPPVAPTARVPEDRPPAPSPAAKKKTWIAIRLVDEADPSRPVPYRRYRIQLPDGGVEEGQLDANGEAHVADIDPGQCEVTFPDYDAKDWRAA